MEQIDLFAIEPTELWVYDHLYPVLSQVITSNNLSINKLKCERTKYYSSVWYDTQMAFRICLRNGSHHFSVSNSLVGEITADLSKRITKEGTLNGFTNFTFNPTIEDVQFFSSFLASALDQAIDGIAKEFDCCSRFEECSNARKCTHPNPNVAIGCGYRKIMKKGRFFYGVNRNID